MEGVLVSAASGALKAVIVKLAALLGDEFKHMKDVRKEIEPLSKELDAIHAFLEKMSGENNPDEQDKRWMTDVRELSYDIEDSLDDFMITIADNKSAKPKDLIKRCKKLLNTAKAHRRIAKAIQDFKTQIKEVGDRNQRYRTGVTSSARDTHELVDIRALAIFSEASELVGIEESKNELIQLLIEDGFPSHHQLKVVSIAGFGGLGKTTLANQVYNSLMDKFDCHSFITVSRNPDTTKLLRTILSDISKKEYPDTEAGDVQHLIKEISNFLQDKRYFIVVDDLWDSKPWEILKCAFINNSCASRIITTTRINEVAEYCLSSYQGQIYNLRPLNVINSRRLFLKRIFSLEEGCPSHLAEVSDDILKKCDGLPLAIIAVAGLLAGKAPTFQEWNKVQSSFGYAIERQSDINKMIQILSLSYFDLAPHLRSCLLYLSIFPEDYEIGKERLIWRWIAEGFIHEGDGYTQHELGERCFYELINRNLVQPLHGELSLTPTACRVHDTILEFIVSKAVEENFVTLIGVPRTTIDPRRKIRRLSLQNKNAVNDGVLCLPENVVYYHARDVSVFHGSPDSLPSLQKLRRVRVLDLEGCESLHARHLAHIGRLFALRYLRLHVTLISELPEEIGELQYLQTLDITGTGIRTLPSSVVHLARLVNLYCSFYMRLPDGFGSMQALERLGCIRSSSPSPSFLQELRQLRNLRWLHMSIGGGCNFIRELASSLSTLGAGSLNSLTIVINSSINDFVMEAWRPTPLNLRLLEIAIPRLPRVPRWIGSLDNLQHLLLTLVQLGPTDVSLLGSLNALSCLSLWVCGEVGDRSSSSQEAQRLKISAAHGFPSLRMLVFSRSKGAGGLGLLFEAGAMPKLQRLQLCFNEYETESVTDGEFDFGIQHLPCLASVACSIMGPSKSELAWNAVKTAVSSHHNHPRLIKGWPTTS